MKLISSTEITDTPIFRVTLDRAIDPDGFEIKRAIVQHDGSAVMMPVDDRGRILLVKQYRLPARQYLWELPAAASIPVKSCCKPPSASFTRKPAIAQRRGKKSQRSFLALDSWPRR